MVCGPTSITKGCHPLRRKKNLIYCPGLVDHYTEAEEALEQFSEKWDNQYPAISPSWRTDWDRLTVFFDFPAEIRKVVYTSNAIELLNYSLRKVLKNRNAFPNDDSVMKLLYLGIKNVARKWTMPVRNWKQALNQFVIIYGTDRVKI